MYEQIGKRYGVDVVQVSESTVEWLADFGCDFHDVYGSDLEAGSVLLVEAEYLTDGSFDSLRIADSEVFLESVVHCVERATWHLCRSARQRLDCGFGEHYEVWQVMDDEIAYVGNPARLADILMRRAFRRLCVAIRLAKVS